MISISKSPDAPITHTCINRLAVEYCSLAAVARSLAGPDLPGEGRSGHYCQHSVDGTGMLARPYINQ